MENEIKLTPAEILNRKFTKDVKGYNPDEVDEFLDCVMGDYMAFLSYVERSKQYAASLLEKNKAQEAELALAKSESAKATDRIRQLEAENASWKERLSHIKPGDHVTEENMDLINKVNIYEEFLLSKGVPPEGVIRAAKKQ